MRKAIVVILGALSFSLLIPKAYSQKLRLELKSIVSNRVRKIYENDNVIIKTEYTTYKGQIKIIDKKYISINGNRIKIEDIVKILKIEK